MQAFDPEAALAALLLWTNSFAMGIGFEPVVGTISGSNTVVFQFDVIQPGQYQMILSDLESPAPFQLLGLGVADETNGLIFADTVGTR